MPCARHMSVLSLREKESSLRKKLCDQRTRALVRDAFEELVTLLERRACLVAVGVCELAIGHVGAGTDNSAGDQ